MNNHTELAIYAHCRDIKRRSCATDPVQEQVSRNQLTADLIEISDDYWRQNPMEYKIRTVEGVSQFKNKVRHAAGLVGKRVDAVTTVNIMEPGFIVTLTSDFGYWDKDKIYHFRGILQ